MISKSQYRLMAGLALPLLLSACAVSPVVQMKSEFWTQTDRSVAVALANVPEAKTHKAGPQGLLDIAINEAMADELTTTLKRVVVKDAYGQTRSEVASRMQARGIKASFVDKTIDLATLKDFGTDDKSRVYANKDFRPLKAELGGADRLLVFTVIAAGTQRSYYGFIPTSRPSAILRARGEIIDLQSNEVLWRETIANTAAIADPWDQPPEFKNVHAAVQKVIADARKSMVGKLFAGAPEVTASK